MALLVLHCYVLSVAKGLVAVQILPAIEATIAEFTHQTLIRILYQGPLLPTELMEVH